MGVIDDYFARFEGITLERLSQMRQAIREEAPQALEVMSYGIPTFDQNGRHLIHFAGYKNHTGLYPTPHGIVEFEAELAVFPQGKGSVQFPHDQPLPLDLVRRIVRHQVAEVLSKPPKKPARSRPAPQG